ncbi:hypothetical protein U6M47_13190, partial [Cutibacterium acnes]
VVTVGLDAEWCEALLTAPDRDTAITTESLCDAGLLQRPDISQSPVPVMLAAVRRARWLGEDPAQPSLFAPALTA